MESLPVSIRFGSRQELVSASGAAFVNAVIARLQWSVFPQEYMPAHTLLYICTHKLYRRAALLAKAKASKYLTYISRMHVPVESPPTHSSSSGKRAPLVIMARLKSTSERGRVSTPRHLVLYGSNNNRKSITRTGL